MDIQKLENKIKELEKMIDELSSKRIGQMDIIPGSIKQRHISEGVIFLRGGVTADKPTSGESSLQGNATFYDVTLKRLYIWNTASSAWDYVQYT